MGGQTLALAQAAAAHVHDHLEAGGRRLHPLFGQQHALLRGEHVALARRAVDEYALQAVLGQHGGIGGDRLRVDVAVGAHRGERGVDQSFDLFHIE